jgi:hypothetical protein
MNSGAPSGAGPSIGPNMSFRPGSRRLNRLPGPGLLPPSLLLPRPQPMRPNRMTIMAKPGVDKAAVAPRAWPPRPPTDAARAWQGTGMRQPRTRSRQRFASLPWVIPPPRTSFAPRQSRRPYQHGIALPKPDQFVLKVPGGAIRQPVEAIPTLDGITGATSNERSGTTP